MISLIISEIKKGDWNAVRSFLGKPLEKGEVRHFGEIPTNQIELVAQDGVLVEIRYWSGMNWNARDGYGRPTRTIR